MNARRACLLAGVATAALLAGACCAVTASGLTLLRVTGDSMEPTLPRGRLLVVRYRGAATAARGDVVVIRLRDVAATDMVKRVAATGGDTVEVRAGVLNVNGRPVAEPYRRAADVRAGIEPPGEWHYAFLLPDVRRWGYNAGPCAWGPMVVPAGALFVLGDNRRVSGDSRAFGFVDPGALVAHVPTRRNRAGPGLPGAAGRCSGTSLSGVWRRPAASPPKRLRNGQGRNARPRPRSTGLSPPGYPFLYSRPDRQPVRHPAPARRETCAEGPALAHAHVDSSDRCPSAPTCRASSSWAPGPSSSARRPSSTTATRIPCGRRDEEACAQSWSGHQDLTKVRLVNRLGAEKFRRTRLSPPAMSAKRKMRRRSQASAQVLEIVYGAMEQPWHARLSRETREALPGLHALVLDDPQSAVTELRAWIEREPLPMFFNWLSMAYSSLGDHPGMDAAIRQNYRTNPQYLFARLNYAELCLRNGDLDRAREALGAGFDIRVLLGGRKRVHVSEVAGYYYAVGLYHIETKDREAAEKMYELLKEVAPGERPTEELRRRLHPRLRDLFSP